MTNQTSVRASNFFIACKPAPCGAGFFLWSLSLHITCNTFPRQQIFMSFLIDFDSKPVENRMASAVPATTMHSGLLRKHAVEKFLFHHPKQETKSEMNRRFATLTLTALVLACVCLATAALAQDDAATKPPAMYLTVPARSS